MRTSIALYAEICPAIMGPRRLDGDGCACQYLRRIPQSVRLTELPQIMVNGFSVIAYTITYYGLGVRTKNVSEADILVWWKVRQFAGTSWMATKTTGDARSTTLLCAAIFLWLRQSKRVSSFLSCGFFPLAVLPLPEDVFWGLWRSLQSPALLLSRSSVVRFAPASTRPSLMPNAIRSILRLESL